MASFNRAEYEDVYKFARTVFLDDRQHVALRQWAAEVMRLCEGVIGQQDNLDLLRMMRGEVFNA
jgi:hypothetical protein